MFVKITELGEDFLRFSVNLGDLHIKSHATVDQFGSMKFRRYIPQVEHNTNFPMGLRQCFPGALNDFRRAINMQLELMAERGEI